MYDKSTRGDGMNQSRGRLVFMAYLVLIVFVLLAGRFFYLQTFKSQHLQEKVVEQRVKEIVDAPERGQILDKNGEVMAYSLMAKDIALYPNLITTESHQEKLAKLLSKELNIPYDDVMKKITAKDDKGNPFQWVSLAKRVDVDVAKRIQDAKLGGIEIKNSPKRYYPNGKLASSILGFVNNAGDPGAGIELSLNRYLSGVPGYRLAETDSVGKTIPIGFENISTALDGQTVTLTVDNYIQHVMEQTLEKYQKELNAEALHAVMINPQTGEIIAMASSPTYDPNNYSEYPKRTWSLNPATYTYEPGSIFKPVYMAMALDGGYITKDFTYEDGGTINVNGATIRNWDGGGLGHANLEDVIINSSNVGMINISQQMTNEQIVEGLKKIGIGQQTGIELPGEEMGLFPRANDDKEDFNNLNNDPIRKATISFGQGISVTPVQLVTAFSSVINGGYQVKAHIVDKVEDKFGNTILDNSDLERKRILKESTSETMKGYLNANMVKGSGKNMQIEGYNMGGKTGSAWFVENGRYVDGEIVGSFMGFDSIENPQVALLVSVVKPDGEFGSTTGGPPWREIMEETLRYLSLNKLDEEAKEIEIPEVQWMLYDEAKEVIEDEIDRVVIKQKGDGQIVTDRTYRYKNGQIEITLTTKDIKTKDGYYIPKLVGMHQVEIQQLFKKSGIAIKEHGSGTVFEQKLEPGYHKTIDELVLWYQ